MKPNRMILLFVMIAAVAVAIAPALVSASSEDAESRDATEAAPPEEAPEPVPADVGPRPIDGCTVSRTCAYPPPSSISCTSYLNDCDEGSEGYGWVECDGQRTYCSAPSCTGHGTPCIKDANCDVDVCTCGQGFCDAQGYCYCPDEPQ